MPDPNEGHDGRGESFESITGETAAERDFGANASTLPAAPRGRFVCLIGPDVGRTYILERLPAMIGREPSADVRLADAEVSRRHARIVRDARGYVLEDLASRNGVIINDEPVARRSLQIGDRIRIGGTLLVYTAHDDLEVRVQQLQRLEALSAMAGALGHDFKNIFAVLLANFENLEPAPVPSYSEAERAECAADIRKAIGRGLEIVERLMRFGRHDLRVEKTPVDLATLIDETVSVLRRTLHEISLEVAVARPLAVRANPGDLHQVLLNLALNARDAMPDGGRLSITGRELQLARADASALHLAVAGTFVEIVVTDTGIGMDEHTMSRVFEPYFTTKPTGKGTGLGLATAYSIIRDLGGNILVTSKPSEGSSFRILIPALTARVRGR